MQGLEVYHSSNYPLESRKLQKMAAGLKLLPTGGSDFHAPNIMNGQIMLGKNFVPDWIYDKLIEEKKCLDMA